MRQRINWCILSLLGKFSLAGKDKYYLAMKGKKE